MCSSVSSATQPAVNALQHHTSPQPPTPAHKSSTPPQDSIQISRAAHKLASMGDTDSDGDGH